MWVQAVRYDLFSSGVFLPYFSMLILSLSLLGMGSTSTSLSPGFCVRRPRQYNTICWELNLISGLFVFFWLIVWADEINKCGWCLPGGKGCWLKGLHQIPRITSLYHHSVHFHIYHIVSFLVGHLCALYCYYKRLREGIGSGYLLYKRVWEQDRGCGLASSLFFFISLVFVFCSFMSWVPLL